MQMSVWIRSLVLDVLSAMGYGGSRSDAAEHLGRSNDEGIDGCIRQDPLGLDQIFVRAKRYAPDRPVDRQAIQAFIGALTGQGVTKGVFITASSFNRNSREFVQRGSHMKVVLIDGDELVELMLRHHIGVRVERKVEVLELDQNHFVVRQSCLSQETLTAITRAANSDSRRKSQLPLLGGAGA